MTNPEERYTDWLLENAIPDGECLLCHMNPNTDKYPKLSENEGAHPFMHRVKKGPVVGKVVMHTCDNPRCIRIEHLVIGTQQDNINDCIIRGRRYKHARMITEEQLIEMQKLRAEGATYVELGMKYGVIKQTIYRYLNGHMSCQ